MVEKDIEYFSFLRGVKMVKEGISKALSGKDTLPLTNDEKIDCLKSIIDFCNEEISNIVK